MSISKKNETSSDASNQSTISELSIIVKMDDLIKWYIPIINHFPRDYRYDIGKNITNQLYDIMRRLHLAKYANQKLDILEALNPELAILQYNTRLLFHFKLIAVKRYQYASQLIIDIGQELGGWIKSQAKKEKRN